MLLSVHVTAADTNDRNGLAEMVIKFKDQIPGVKKLWADMGYQGQKLKLFMEQQGINLEIVKRPRKYFYIPNEVKDVDSYLKSKGIEVVEGFKLLSRRWVVERTFAWIGRYRRMSKDYEFLTNTQENMIRLAMSKNMVKRIVKLLT